MFKMPMILGLLNMDKKIVSLNAYRVQVPDIEGRRFLAL
jgi:hypothetical protein